MTGPMSHSGNARAIAPRYSTRFDVELKGAVDPVTVVDKQAEEAIFDVIYRLRPDARS